jgi:hypothetical protein
LLRNIQGEIISIILEEKTKIGAWSVQIFTKGAFPIGCHIFSSESHPVNALGPSAASNNAPRKASVAAKKSFAK